MTEKFSSGENGENVFDVTFNKKSTFTAAGLAESAPGAFSKAKTSATRGGTPTQLNMKFGEFVVHAFIGPAVTRVNVEGRGGFNMYSDIDEMFSAIDKFINEESDETEEEAEDTDVVDEAVQDFGDPQAPLEDVPVAAVESSAVISTEPETPAPPAPPVE